MATLWAQVFTGAEQADKYAAATRKKADEDAAAQMAVVGQREAIHAKNVERENNLLDERSAKLTADIAANDARVVDIGVREVEVAKREESVRLAAKANGDESVRLALVGSALDKRQDALIAADNALQARADRIAAAIA